MARTQKKEPKEHEKVSWEEWPNANEWEDWCYQFKMRVMLASGRPTEDIFPWIKEAFDDQISYRELKLNSHF